MATLSTTMLNGLASKWEDLYGSAVLSGIVGDLAHKARGGYHISREDQPKDNYSVIQADDKPGNGPNDRASAIDMTMSTADIIKCHTRLRTIWKNRASDPRMKYLNAWNGWDGEGDAGRYDVVKGTISTASSDHKWHIHLEIRRKYVNDLTAQKAILSMLKGETLAQYTGTTTPAPPQDEDEDMPTAQEIAKAVWDYQLARPEDTTKTISAGTYQRYNDQVNDGAADKVIAALKPLIAAGDVDETVLANALAGNSAFAAALANAISAKLPSGVTISPDELTAAVKTALRDGVAS